MRTARIPAVLGSVLPDWCVGSIGPRAAVASPSDASSGVDESVEHALLVNRGDVGVVAPSFSSDRLSMEVPDEVDVPVTLDGRSHSCPVPASIEASRVHLR